MRSERKIPMEKLSTPARRALASAGYSSLEQLAGRSEKDLLHLHGIGPKVITILREVLAENGLAFRSAEDNSEHQRT